MVVGAGPDPAAALGDWYGRLSPLAWTDLVAAAGGARRTAVLVVDMVAGFVGTGPLASGQVAAVVPAVARIAEQAVADGAPVWLIEDCHDPGAAEFRNFPPHCLAGTAQAATIPELQPLLSRPGVRRLRKNCLSVLAQQDLLADLVDLGVRTAVVVGDCTDLCVYHTAVPLALAAQGRGVPLDVVVPAAAVATYHQPAGPSWHPADLFHRLFLYHMALVGVRVVADLATGPDSRPEGRWSTGGAPPGGGRHGLRREPPGAAGTPAPDLARRRRTGHGPARPHPPRATD